MNTGRSVGVALLCTYVCFDALNAAPEPANQRIQELRGIAEADLNHDGSRVIVRLRNGEIGIWNVTDGTRVPGDLGLGATAERYQMSSDGQAVVILLAEGVRVFDATTAGAVSPLLNAKARKETRQLGAFSPDRLTLVVFEEQAASVWDTSTGERVTSLPFASGPHEDAPPSATFTAAGDFCFVMQPEGTVTRYETKSWKPSRKPMTPPSFDTAYEFGFAASEDGRWIATFDDAGENGPKGQLHVWDAISSKRIGSSMIGVNGFDARFFADRVLIRPARGNATVRALPSLKVLYTIPAHDEIEGPSVDLTRDGKWILVWGSDQRLALHDAADGKLKESHLRSATISAVLPAPDSAVCYMVYDNSTFLADGHYDNYIMKLTLPELKVTGSFRSSGFLGRASLSANGSRLVTTEGASDDERLLIFNTADMSLLVGAQE